MSILQALILGIVEGLTEFLPVSSTFHLIFTSRILQVPLSDFEKLFEVFIQSGSILAVLLLFFKDLWKDKLLIIKAGVAFIPTGAIGFLLHDYIKSIFEFYILLVIVFMAVGLVFLLVESLLQKGKVDLKKTISDISWKDALIIGTIQALAVVPGVSRAGSVIVGMMFMRYRRDEAARFSFILSIPTIFAASLYDLYKMRDVVTAESQNMYLLAIGFITAFVSALFVMRWFIQFLKTNTLVPFAYYRFFLGAVILVLGFMQVIPLFK